MYKITINGEDWTTVDEIAYAVHAMREEIKNSRARWKKEWTAEEAIDSFVKMLFAEEYGREKTDWMKNRIVEMPGKYVIYRCVEEKSGKSILEYCAGTTPDFDVIVTQSGDKALKIDYMSDAQEIMDSFKNNGNWRIGDVSRAAYRHQKRILDIILKKIESVDFEDDDEEDDDSGEDCTECVGCEYADECDGCNGCIGDDLNDDEDDDTENRTEQDAEKGPDDDDKVRAD